MEGGLLRLLQCGETFLPAIKRVETRALSYLIQVRSTALEGSVEVLGVASAGKGQ